MDDVPMSVSSFMNIGVVSGLCSSRVKVRLDLEVL